MLSYMVLLVVILVSGKPHLVQGFVGDWNDLVTRQANPGTAKVKQQCYDVDR